MKRTRRTNNMIGLSMLLASCVMHSPAIVLAERPNVIILFTDDQGTLDANCYGSADLHTPHIDKLAAPVCVSLRLTLRPSAARPARCS